MVPITVSIGFNIPDDTAGILYKLNKHNTRDVRNELLIVLYLDIHVGHDKNQYISI